MGKMMFMHCVFSMFELFVKQHTRIVQHGLCDILLQAKILINQNRLNCNWLLSCKEFDSKWHKGHGKSWVAVSRMIDNMPNTIRCDIMHHRYVLILVSCQKGPTRHAYAWQIGPFWQDTLDYGCHPWRVMLIVCASEGDKWTHILYVKYQLVWYITIVQWTLWDKAFTTRTVYMAARSLQM